MAIGFGVVVAGGLCGTRLIRSSGTGVRAWFIGGTVSGFVRCAGFACAAILALGSLRALVPPVLRAVQTLFTALIGAFSSLGPLLIGPCLCRALLICSLVICALLIDPFLRQPIGKAGVAAIG